MSVLTLQSVVALPSGHKIPQLGFGLGFGYGKPNENVEELTKPALAEALKVGYRHIDTAEMYGNENLVGEVVVSCGIPREEIFLTSKVPASYSTHAQCMDVIDQSLRLLQTDYLNLYLIHMPPKGKTARLTMWKTLIEAKKQGKVRDIGVSNYNVNHLQEIKDSGLEMPAINQIELHPLCQQKPIVDFCTAHGIIVSPYCSIIRGALDHPLLLEIAKKHGKEPAQILLRWSLQRGFIPLMRSSNPKRIKSNCDLYDFALDGEDMKRLNALDKGTEGAIGWNPIFVD